MYAFQKAPDAFRQRSSSGNFCSTLSKKSSYSDPSRCFTLRQQMYQELDECIKAKRSYKFRATRPPTYPILSKTLPTTFRKKHIVISKWREIVISDTFCFGNLFAFYFECQELPYLTNFRVVALKHRFLFAYVLMRRRQDIARAENVSVIKELSCNPN